MPLQPKVVCNAKSSYKIMHYSFGTRLTCHFLTFWLVSAVSRVETRITSRYLEITSSSFGYNEYFNNSFEE